MTTRPENAIQSPIRSPNLDPEDWKIARASAHRALDQALDHIQTLGDAPLWQAPDPGALSRLNEPLPAKGLSLDSLSQQVADDFAPFSSGNGHPGFMGWVQGGGNLAGVLGDLWAASINANLGGRHHMAIQVEQQITRWMAELSGFPQNARGLFVTGASQANFMGVLMARHRAKPDVRKVGLESERLIAYGSKEMHGCLTQALELAGLGSEALKCIAVDEDYRIDITALRTRILSDIAAGMRPFLLIGNAGCVNTGAIDNLQAMAEIASEFDLHFHVDGALGAPACLSSTLRPRFAGLERADSLAFDFHKWLQVPFDAGFILARDETLMKATFVQDNAYLSRAETGLAAGDFWPCDYGPDLSRGFRALKAWFTLKAFGTDQLGAMIEGTCALARYLERRLKSSPDLEVVAPVSLNIVCFSVHLDDPIKRDLLNGLLIEALHAEGRVAPSITWLKGRKVMRAAIVNHRTRSEDIDALIEGLDRHLKRLLA